jgi:ribonuclease P protein component
VKLAASDEKDLSASQPPTQTNPRVPRPDGHAGRTKSAQTPARQGPRTPRHLNPAQAAGLIEARASQSFGAADRLHRSAQFLHLQQHGMRLQSPHFVLYAGKIPDSVSGALGVTVSRRIGNAVARNRVKRRIRECYRRSLRDEIPAGLAIVVIARTGAAALDFDSLSIELHDAAAKLKEKLAR